MIRRTLLVGAAAVAGLAPAAVAVIPEAAPELPVLAEELERGSGSTVPRSALEPTPKTIDGDAADWIGEPTGFGGTAVYSAGEFVYQDHLFDAWGPDDGRDAERLATLDALQEAEPRSYRLEPLIGQDPPSQFGVDSPDPVRGDEHYGDHGLVDEADLVEVRLAHDGTDLFVMARTTTMDDDSVGGLAVLLDTDGVTDAPVEVPGAGVTTTRADQAVLISPSEGVLVDLATGAATEIPVAANPSGYENVLEAAIPVIPESVALVSHSKTGSWTGPANVAFRTDERVRTFFDRAQALALYEGSVDEFFVDLDLAGMQAGRTEEYVPGPGYHDRIFRSAEHISDERGMEGVWQHYGLYLPDDWAGVGPFPVQWWFHWRGGHAHSAAGVIPRMFRTLGDGEGLATPVTGIDDSVVVAPRGRGTSHWYVGIGHADYLEVWDDVHALLGDRVDRAREYITGHSMGGWASYLLPILYPDRFAASFPYSGPVTQGAWTGLDAEGCDDLQWEEYSPCYIEANDSRPRDQHTRRLLENLHNVPIAIFQGAADELVPTSGVTRQVEELTRLGLRHRYYLFPHYEHFSFPIVDEWAEGGRYAHRFSVPEQPARVRYVRDRAFEEATEAVSAEGRIFDFAFDSAYWMRGLEIADGAEAARFDGRTLAVADDHLAVPEAGGPTAPGQSGPYVMEGLRWVDDPLAGGAGNGFRVSLEGVSTVELDLPGMAIDPAERIDGYVSTDGGVTLRLDGSFPSLPPVACADCEASLDGGVLVLEVPAGNRIVAVG